MPTDDEERESAAQTAGYFRALAQAQCATCRHQYLSSTSKPCRTCITQDGYTAWAWAGWGTDDWRVYTTPAKRARKG